MLQKVRALNLPTDKGDKRTKDGTVYLMFLCRISPDERPVPFSLMSQAVDVTSFSLMSQAVPFSLMSQAVVCGKFDGFHLS
jgi:hypothetical protein